MSVSENIQERFCYQELTGEERSLFYKMRYQEYVIDRNWEKPNSDCLERDSFDEFSYHFGCFKESDGQLVAAARLIDAKRTTLLFEGYTRKPIDRNGLEISRFIVRKEKIEKREKCPVRNGLFYVLQQFAEQKSYDYMYAFITLRYFQALKRTGVGFLEVIGEAVNFKNNLYLPVSGRVDVIGEYFLTNKLWKLYSVSN